VEDRTPQSAQAFASYSSSTLRPESHADNCQQVEGRIKFYECVGEDMVVAGAYLQLFRAIWAAEAVQGPEYTCSLLSVYTPDCCMGDNGSGHPSGASGLRGLGSIPELPGGHPLHEPHAAQPHLHTWLASQLCHVESSYNTRYAQNTQANKKGHTTSICVAAMDEYTADAFSNPDELPSLTITYSDVEGSSSEAAGLSTEGKKELLQRSISPSRLQEKARASHAEKMENSPGGRSIHDRLFAK
jgi:hypothetical protein